MCESLFCILKRANYIRIPGYYSRALDQWGRYLGVRAAHFTRSTVSALISNRDAPIRIRCSVDFTWKSPRENGRRTVAVPAEARRPGRFVLQLHRLALTGKESLPFLRGGGGLNGDLVADRLVATAADTAVHHHAAARAAGVGQAGRTVHGDGTSCRRRCCAYRWLILLQEDTRRRHDAVGRRAGRREAVDGQCRCAAGY